jgi:hypothetical protein
MYLDYDDDDGGGGDCDTSFPVAFSCNYLTCGVKNMVDI